MTLTTHAIAGSLVGAIAYHNLPFALIAALLSHPLLDAIPHWDYTLASGHDDPTNKMNNDMHIGGKKFYIDLLKIGCDFWLGLIIVILVFHTASFQLFLAALLGALVAILPDPLQFVYWKTRSRIIKPFQEFHMYLHAELTLKKHLFLGLIEQAAIIGIVLILIHYIV